MTEGLQSLPPSVISYILKNLLQNISIFLAGPRHTGSLGFLPHMPKASATKHRRGRAVRERAAGNLEGAELPPWA